MRPYGKNKPNNMHAKQMPSGAQRTHSLIIFTRGVSHLHRQEVASGCLISSDWKHARRREQGDNYTLLSTNMCLCSLFFVAHPKWHMWNIMHWCFGIQRISPSSAVRYVKMKLMFFLEATFFKQNWSLCFQLLWLLCGEGCHVIPPSPSTSPPHPPTGFRTYSSCLYQMPEEHPCTASK